MRLYDYDAGKENTGNPSAKDDTELKGDSTLLRKTPIIYYMARRLSGPGSIGRSARFWFAHCEDARKPPFHNRSSWMCYIGERSIKAASTPTQIEDTRHYIIYVTYYRRVTLSKSWVNMLIFKCPSYNAEMRLR